MVAGLGVKAVAAVSLAGGSYLTGTLPSCLGIGRSCSQSLTLSLVLCFGAGVLFATSVLHVQPEARDQLSDWADLIFCFGFMLLFLTDELVKLFERSHCFEDKGFLDKAVHKYGSLEHEEQPEYDESNQTGSISIKLTSSDTKTRAGLLIALSVHSVIEGIVIGVQPASGKVLMLLCAVSSHKLVVSFCLGAELASDGRSFLSLSQSMLVYSLGSAAGIILGALTDQWLTNTNVSSIPVLQALAAGSLLYVTVSEVLPRERSRWEHQSQQPSAGILQLISFFFGFTVITSLILVT